MTPAFLTALSTALLYAYDSKNRRGFDFDAWSALVLELYPDHPDRTSADLERDYHALLCSRGKHFLMAGRCTRCGASDGCATCHGVSSSWSYCPECGK